MATCTAIDRKVPQLAQLASNATKPQNIKPRSAVNEVSDHVSNQQISTQSQPSTQFNCLRGTVRAVMESILEGSNSSQGLYMIRSASPDTSVLAITDEFDCIADNNLA